MSEIRFHPACAGRSIALDERETRRVRKIVRKDAEMFRIARARSEDDARGHIVL